MSLVLFSFDIEKISSFFCSKLILSIISLFLSSMFSSFCSFWPLFIIRELNSGKLLFWILESLIISISFELIFSLLISFLLFSLLSICILIFSFISPGVPIEIIFEIIIFSFSFSSSLLLSLLSSLISLLSSIVSLCSFSFLLSLSLLSMNKLVLVFWTLTSLTEPGNLGLGIIFIFLVSLLWLLICSKPGNKFDLIIVSFSFSFSLFSSLFLFLSNIELKGFV